MKVVGLAQQPEEPHRMFSERGRNEAGPREDQDGIAIHGSILRTVGGPAGPKFRSANCADSQAPQIIAHAG
jgi:hypothetical protein